MEIFHLLHCFLAKNMKKLSESEIKDLICQKEYSIIHVDADWDNHRFYIKRKIEIIQNKYKNVSFGYVDCEVAIVCDATEGTCKVTGVASQTLAIS